MRALFGVALLATAAAAAQSTPGQIVTSTDTVEMPVAHLRGLDTLNGRTQDMAVRAGETLAFGHLEVTLEACRVPRAAPEDDAYGLLRIRDIREPEPRFEGWMFASSPALSALDHPRYDVWVLSCSNS